MRQFALVLLASVGLFTASAQTSPKTYEFKKGKYLTLNIGMYDFATATAIRSTSLNNVLSNKKWSKLRNCDPAFGLGYMQGLTNHLDLATSLSGSFVQYPFRNRATSTSDVFLLDANAVVNLKLLTDKYVVVPYLSAGFGASLAKNYLGALVPVGAGIQINLFKETFLMTNFQYRLPITENASHHFYYNIGVAAKL